MAHLPDFPENLKESFLSKSLSEQVGFEPLGQFNQQNFLTLLLAARDGRLALVSARDTKTGESTMLMCGINYVPNALDGNVYHFVPLATLLSAENDWENPYERFVIPTDRDIREQQDALIMVGVVDSGNTDVEDEEDNGLQNETAHETDTS